MLSNSMAQMSITTVTSKSRKNRHEGHPWSTSVLRSLHVPTTRVRLSMSFRYHKEIPTSQMSVILTREKSVAFVCASCVIFGRSERREAFRAVFVARGWPSLPSRLLPALRGASFLTVWSTSAFRRSPRTNGTLTVTRSKVRFFLRTAWRSCTLALCHLPPP